MIFGLLGDREVVHIVVQQWVAENTEKRQCVYESEE